MKEHITILYMMIESVMLYTIFNIIHIYIYMLFPKQSVLYGVLAEQGASGSLSPVLALTLAKNVARTIGFKQISKINELWLQCGGRSHHATAATAHLFS